MTKLRIFPSAAASYATPYDLKFFDYSGHQMEVSEVTGSRNSGTFKLNGVKATITCPNIYVYSSYYYIHYSLLANNYAMLTSQTAATIADPVAKNAGFLITFEENMYIKEIELKENRSGYNCSGYRAMVNEDRLSEPVAVPGLNKPFRIKLPVETIRCLVGKNGHYYFLRPTNTVSS